MTHHAYYIEGPTALFEAYKQEIKPFWAQKFEKFGVDDARALVELASLKQPSQTFLVALSSITTEAQQALLKLFEEPQEGTTFILLLPHGVLLPTVRSRMMAYTPQQSPLKSPRASRLATPSPRSSRGPDFSQDSATPFLKATGKARSDYIAKLLKEEENTKERVRVFVDALEVELHKKINDPAARAGLRDIAMVRDYLGDRSPSLKMLLEHLAVSLPTV